MDSTIPTILFGAFDRHNFGDLLFAHIAAALLPKNELLFAGLAERDLRACGGHHVQPLSRLITEIGSRPVLLMHVGGEILTCTAWQAAIMLQAPDTVQGTIARLESVGQARQAWVAQQLGVSGLAPYCVSRVQFPAAQAICYLGVGGVELGNCAPALQAEVLAKLGQADGLGVRDGQTLAYLHSAGIPATLMPDPAVLVAQLFDPEIYRHVQQGEVAIVKARFPQGYLAVQFSADFGDDATLAGIAVQLEQLVMETGLGVVLFRAGAAPWHDDLAVYRRLKSAMHRAQVALFESLHLWDICALIAGSDGYCGSSLHGRIVAMAYALPRLNLVHSVLPGEISKQAAYAASWEVSGYPHVVVPAHIAQGMLNALAVEPALLQQHAAWLSERFLTDCTSVLLKWHSPMGSHAGMRQDYSP